MKKSQSLYLIAAGLAMIISGWIVIQDLEKKDKLDAQIVEIENGSQHRELTMPSGSSENSHSEASASAMLEAGERAAALQNRFASLDDSNTEVYSAEYLNISNELKSLFIPSQASVEWYGYDPEAVRGEWQFSTPYTKSGVWTFKNLDNGEVLGYALSNWNESEGKFSDIVYKQTVKANSYTPSVWEKQNESDIEKIMEYGSQMQANARPEESASEIPEEAKQQIFAARDALKQQAEKEGGKK